MVPAGAARAGIVRMRLRPPRGRRRPPDPPADDRTGLETRYWETHAADLISAGLGTMLRQLPALVGAALRLAWRANRRDTAVALGGNVLAGVFTAFGLLATSEVLASLFAGCPPPRCGRSRCAGSCSASTAGLPTWNSGSSWTSPATRPAPRRRGTCSPASRTSPRTARSAACCRPG
ncbi:hypothetical protein [Spirillospora sp. CA-128828]|uniref:hypothetical protein n=1 Tax=Spirillospora sp. CA-128828 TaxID=3240033 RepID=UPI003D8F0F91